MNTKDAIASTDGLTLDLVQPIGDRPAQSAVVTIYAVEGHEFQAFELRTIAAILSASADELDRINAKRRGGR